MNAFRFSATMPPMHRHSRPSPQPQLHPGHPAAVKAFAFLAAGLGVVLGASAQTPAFTLDWFTIDGGGGVSAGGGFTVQGTIGQPDAGGPMAGGVYAVTGGFWVLPVAVVTAGAPQLAIVPAGPGQARISWAPVTAGYVLQQATTLNPPDWSNAPSGASNPVIVPASAPARYYRLQKP